MGSYMFKVSYSADGLKGVIKEGAEHRAAFIGSLYDKHGGKMESFHFAFGETDVYVIGELPDDTTAAAIAMAVGAAGVGKCETVKLLTPAEAERRARSPPGTSPPARST